MNIFQCFIKENLQRDLYTSSLHEFGRRSSTMNSFGQWQSYGRSYTNRSRGPFCVINFGHPQQGLCHQSGLVLKSVIRLMLFTSASGKHLTWSLFLYFTLNSKQNYKRDPPPSVSGLMQSGLSTDFDHRSDGFFDYPSARSSICWALDKIFRCTLGMVLFILF